MSFYCLVWLWTQLIDISVLRTWKIFKPEPSEPARTSVTFFCSLMTRPLAFKTVRSLWKVCFFLYEIYGLIMFQNFFWSECLSLQILEKWSLTLFLLILTALFLSWRYFSHSSGLLDLLNRLLQRLRSLITSRIKFRIYRLKLIAMFSSKRFNWSMVIQNFCEHFFPSPIYIFRVIKDVSRRERNQAKVATKRAVIKILERAHPDNFSFRLR